MERRWFLAVGIFLPHWLSVGLAERSTSLRGWFKEWIGSREVERTVTIAKISILLETSDGNFVLDSIPAKLRPGDRISISFYRGNGGLFQYLTPKRVTAIQE